MLDLAGSTRSLAGVTLAHDTAGPKSWLVLPAPPHPTQTPSGPDVQLLRFVDNGTLSGGFLRLGIDLGNDPASITAAQAALEDETPTHDPVTLAALPILAGTADLVFYGREPTEPGVASPLILSSYGSSPLQLQPPHRATFAIRLTADGVRAVETGLRAHASSIGVTCRYNVEGLWPAIRVTARVDWNSAYDHFSTSYHLGALLFSADVTQLMQTLTQAGAVQINVIDAASPAADGTSSSSAAIAGALAFVQTALLEQFCRPVLPLDTPAAQAVPGDSDNALSLGAAYQVVALDKIENGTAWYDFSEATVARRTLTGQATLGDLLGPADPASVISDAGLDDPFYVRFHLDCHSARPLADSHLDEAVLAIAYGQASGSVRLAPDNPDGAFDCYADASPDGTWTVSGRVTFAADSPLDPGAPVDLAPVTGTSRDLTLDLEAMLGMSTITVERAADPRVTASAVTVTQVRDGQPLATQQLSLTAAAPSGAAWFRDRRVSDAMTVAGTHLLSDGRQVPITALTADTALVRLPDPYAGSVTVQIATDPTWTDLQRVVVAIAKDAGAPVVTVSFDTPGTAAVALDQPDPVDRSYRYQVSRTVAGVTTTDPWLTADLPLLSVGSTQAGDLVVDVEPVGPELTTVGLRQVAIDLLYVDVAHQLRAEHTVVISAKSDHYRWQVHLADPALRAYQYRVTKYLLNGESRAGAWLDSSDSILPVAITAS